ncbi:class I SAM-dependent methyltransferase [Geobacter sp.]|uniref:class I SAM-dependent methyltransferase n=1 Tax=Geobacter sp. TaxID=46610 RepID=UPI00262603C0|nr:class I SAM-dependent methyltransferase [Geobacter sp.]
MPQVLPFEKCIERHEAWYERHSHAYRAELAAVRELLPEKGNGVEIGVGTGRFASPLGIGIGVEPSPSMGKVAAERGIQVVEGVAERLPFPDQSFDFLLMVNVVCFLDDPIAAFREAWRVLRDGGSLVVGFIDADSPLGREYQEKKGASPFYREAHFHTSAETISWFRAAGFADLAFRQTLFRPLEEINSEEPVREGYGEGSFVVVRGRKAPH